ncbi:MAG: VOC family protein [Vicinamibacterales bacterium]
MSVITAHAAGTFCWPELSTSDAPAAKKFYSTLFKWEPDDQPMPQGGPYTMLKLGGEDVGALHTLHEGQKKAGVPPHWMSYVAVTNADETAKKAASLGGTVLVPPFDVMDHGRMAVIQDPTGAIFSIWQAKAHPGATRINEVGALVWTELYTRDPDNASAFYSRLLGWRPKPWEGPMPYTVFNLAGEERMAGGMLSMPDEMEGVPPHWLPYFQVDDTDKIVARARELGANVIMPPTDVPKVGRLAIVADPQGASFAVIKTVPMV